MSDTSHGEGWWIAADGKWYAPETHPDLPRNQVPADTSQEPEPAVEYEATRTCPNGHRISQSAAFCDTCGIAIEASTAHPLTQEQPVDTAQPETETVARTRSKRWIVVTLIVVVIAGLGAAGVLVGVNKSKTHDITGTFALNQTRDDQGVAYKVGDPCTASSGYTDIAAGTQVQVTDSSGKLLAFGSLDSGRAALDPSGSQVFKSVDSDGNSLDSDSSDPNGYSPETDCVFNFTLTGVADTSLYQVAVSHRGQQSYSLDELQQSNWNIGMQLGTSESGVTPASTTTTTSINTGLVPTNAKWDCPTAATVTADTGLAVPEPTTGGIAHVNFQCYYGPPRVTEITYWPDSGGSTFDRFNVTGISGSTDPTPVAGVGDRAILLSDDFGSAELVAYNAQHNTTIILDFPLGTPEPALASLARSIFANL